LQDYFIKVAKKMKRNIFKDGILCGLSNVT